MPRSQGTREQRALCLLLRETRTGKNLTQAEVASRLDRPQSYVSKYETGERRLDLVELGEVCTAMEIELVDFIRAYESRRRPR